MQIQAEERIGMNKKVNKLNKKVKIITAALIL